MFSDLFILFFLLIGFNFFRMIGKNGDKFFSIRFISNKFFCVLGDCIEMDYVCILMVMVWG